MTSLAIQALKNFVCETCGRRPPSHSADHMESVCRLSFKLLGHQTKLYYRRNNVARKLLIATVAWLHDVCDHKYNCDKLLVAFNIFINKYCVDFGHIFANTIYQKLFNPVAIDTMIKMISFSAERDRPDWFAEQAKNIGSCGMVVRNIVSDADKLEALGMAGLHRCLSYIREVSPTMSEDEAKNILRPFNENNLKKRADYVRTKYAKKMACVLVIEMDVEKM